MPDHTPLLPALNRRHWLRSASRMAAASGLLGTTGLLTACGGGDDDPVHEDIGEGLLSTTPENQAATYRNVDRLPGFFRTIAAGPARPLRQASGNLADLRYDFAGQSRSINDFFHLNRTAGLLVLKNGAIAHEQYGMGNTASAKWTSFSVAKSVTATLIGAALNDGAIGSLNDPITRYVPALANSPYKDNTIAHLLNMCSGVAWDEVYTATGDSDIARLGVLLTANEPGAMMALMANRARVAAPGSVYNYSTGESYVLGAVVQGAIGGNLSDYLSRKIWQPCGMESSGFWVLDQANGLEMGGNNFSATLRDYGRFGQFIMTDGQAHAMTASRVLPVGWRDLAGSPRTPQTGYGALVPGYPLGYGYQWWPIPPGVAGAREGAPTFTAEGIFGQFILVNPDEHLVVVLWSAWHNAWEDAAEAEFYTLVEGITQALR